jgi:hypothetical protein
LWNQEPSLNNTLKRQHLNGLNSIRFFMNA